MSLEWQSPCAAVQAAAMSTFQSSGTVLFTPSCAKSLAGCVFQPTVTLIEMEGLESCKLHNSELTYLLRNLRTTVGSGSTHILRIPGTNGAGQSLVNPVIGLLVQKIDRIGAKVKKACIPLGQRSWTGKRPGPGGNRVLLWQTANLAGLLGRKGHNMLFEARSPTPLATNCCADFAEIIRNHSSERARHRVWGGSAMHSIFGSEPSSWEGEIVTHQGLR